MTSWFDNYLVLDTETTGLDADKCRILELGLARFERGVLVEQANYLIRCESKDWKEEISRISGITWADVFNAPEWPEVWREVEDLVARDDVAFVAYNAPFDRRFVGNRVRPDAPSALPLLTKAWIDPLPFAWALNKQGPNKLVNVCARHGVDLSNAHNALADATATGRVLPAVLRAYDSALVEATIEKILDVQLLLTTQRARYYKGGSAVFVCDGCGEAKASVDAKKAPAGWTLRDDKCVTCSLGCDAQLLWWKTD